MRTFRRMAVSGILAVGLVAAVAGPAFAHECYNTQRSDTSTAAAAGSNGWATFSDEVAQFVGPLCPAGVQVLAQAAGVTPTTLIHQNSLMAGGTVANTGHPGTPAISYLNIAALQAAVPAAFQACA
jgi:D-arabinose 1-dehydrogenase-like Zn-dependent alcohol dehydrogenase